MINKKQKGFTLIELMIVVAIVGIISAIAYPSYNQYIVRSKRGDAISALVLAQGAMERFRSNKPPYTYDLGTNLSSVFATQVPVEGGTPYYNLTLISNATSYTLTATPTGSMTGLDGSLSVTNTGARTWTDDVGATHTCWPEGGNTC